MITRKRIKITEKLVALKWQQFLGQKLITEEGKWIKVVYPGRDNCDSGPDFCDAILAEDGRNLIKGDIEVHVKSSDWYSHGHHNDPAYNNIILHVVMWSKCGFISTYNGNFVPEVCLANVQYQELTSHHLPCFHIVLRKDRQTLLRILDVAGDQRFKQKAMGFQTNMQWEETGEVLLKGIMRALGYSKNTAPFEELARRVPLSFIEKVEPMGSLSLKKAWLLGMSGLLPSQRLGGEFSKGAEVQELEYIWESVGKKAETMRESSWNFSHIYPNNSPVRRIIAHSYLVQRYNDVGLLRGILRLVEETPVVASDCRLVNGLIVFGDSYWQEHFDFDVKAKTRKSALLGRGKAGGIIVDVVLPFVYALGEKYDVGLKERAVELYRSYPRLAGNKITRHMMRQLGLEFASDFTACQQQGLIHIFRNYCREGRCLECPLAN